MWVMYPTSSLANACFLNPDEKSAFDPKFELELLIDWSPPESVTKCSANPIAKIETSWVIESLDVLMWKFLYAGL